MAQQLRREDYTVGWVCALPIELAAAQEMLDEEHKTPQTEGSDTNIYTCGRIGDHNVVIACLPEGQTGTSSAAAVAVQMHASFTSTRFGLMVGIGGGVPSEEADIRLGDVVVSSPAKTHGGVVQYDFGKTTPSGFERTGSLNTPPTILLHAIRNLRARRLRGRSPFYEYLSKLERLSMFSREAAGEDILYRPEFKHRGGPTCNCCSRNSLSLEWRESRDIEGEVEVHYGTIASGNQVMRDSTERDRVSKELGGVLCFEMEAAGLMNTYPCIIIRGICDYSDSHKNKKWQPYAAGTAAAYAKEILSVIPSMDIARSNTVKAVVGGNSEVVVHIREEQFQQSNRVKLMRTGEAVCSGGLRLLSLDGGGVRVKSCDVFDLIGGIGIGGLIVIMLGRLEMDVEQCITAYCQLMRTVFEEEVTGWFSSLNLFGNVKVKFDSNKLRGAIEEIVRSTGRSATDLFKSEGDSGCRTFVCSVSRETSNIARLRSYSLPDESDIDATICEAALATSASTSFFDPVSIGSRQFVDGGLGANNPVEELEGEAKNIWDPEENSDLKSLVQCFVSIGTGNPGMKAIQDNIAKFLSETLVDIVTETEKTERKFIARWTKHYKAMRYFRFNVEQGLQDVGLAEYKEQGRIDAATEEYLSHQVQKIRVQECAQSLQKR